MPVVYTRADRQDVEAFIRALPAAMAGTGPDRGGIGAGFRARLGWTFYSLVAEDFQKLGRGETASDGSTWPRNSPKYLAYGKGPASSRRGRGQMPQNRPGGPRVHGSLGRGPGTGDLSQAQLRQWWGIYGRWKAFFATRMSIGEAKARAAAMAWNALKQRGASTKLGRLGNRPDQVLVDRGSLRRSLLPGEITEQQTTAHYEPNGEEQLFEDTGGSVIVGSRNEHAKKHHEGEGRLPVRRLWPKEIPDVWWEDILDVAASGIRRIADLFGGSRP